MHVVLVEPQIPPNTGSVARLCAATQTPLHLVGRLGFQMTNRHLKRAGLDYWEYTPLYRHASLESFIADLAKSQLFLFSKKGRKPYIDAPFHQDAFLVFGSETRGLPQWLLERYPQRVWTIPMFHPQVRSLNLATAVAIVLYEALRQTGKLESPASPASKQVSRLTP